MGLEALWRPLLLYTGLLGVLTVGAVSLATQSLLAVLVLAAGGLLIAVLNGGTAGRTSLGGTDPSDEGDTEFEAAGLLPHTSRGVPPRFALLCYGLGVFLWSVVVLATLRDSLA